MGLGLTPGWLCFELESEGRGSLCDVAAPRLPPSARWQRWQLPQRRAGDLLHVGELLAPLRAPVDEAVAGTAGEALGALRRIEGAHSSPAGGAGDARAPPGSAVELEFVLRREAHAIEVVAVGEEEILRRVLLPADHIGEAGEGLAAVAASPEDLAARLTPPAPLVAKLTELEGAALIDAEARPAPATTEAAHLRSPPSRLRSSLRRAAAPSETGCKGRHI